MREATLTLFVIATATLALAPAFAAGQEVDVQTMGTHVATALKTDVAGEWKVITVELAPGAVDAHQTYPGVELVYVLEGAGFLEVDGKAPVALNPGVVAALNPKQIHVLKNTSPTQTLKVLVVLLLEKGHQRPMLANGEASGHQNTQKQMANVGARQQRANAQDNSTSPGLVF